MCLSFLTSTQPFTQPNSLTIPETIWVKFHHRPTLLPSPHNTQLPHFSGNALASDNSPSGGTLPLCISHCIFIPLSNFKHPGLSWCDATFPALVGEVAVDPALQSSCGSRRPQCQVTFGDCSNLSPCAGPNIISLPSVSTSSTILASKLRISLDSVGCLLCSSEDQLVVPVECTCKWVRLPPTLHHLPVMEHL